MMTFWRMIGWLGSLEKFRFFLLACAKINFYLAIKMLFPQYFNCHIVFCSIYCIYVTNFFYSPWIVATSVLRCAAFLNSHKYIPCQVPNANFPPEIGMVTLVPVSTVLTCAGWISLLLADTYHIITPLSIVSVICFFWSKFIQCVNHILSYICIPIPVVKLHF